MIVGLTVLRQLLRKSIKLLPPELLLLAQICTKSFVGWGFAPDPTGGAYSAPRDLLAGSRSLLLRGGKGRERKGRGPTSKGRGGERRGGERMEKKREGRKRMAGQFPNPLLPVCLRRSNGRICDHCTCLYFSLRLWIVILYPAFVS